MTTHHAGGVDAFDVRDQLIEDYRPFAAAFVDSDASRIKEYVADRLERGEQWPNPSLSLSPAIESDGTASDLMHRGILDAECILKTFPIAKRRNLAAHGTFRTKLLILAAYDQMPPEVLA